MEDVTLVNNATCMNTKGMIWQCGGVLCTKNYSPPSGNEEYYTTASQCEKLCSRTLCWFANFAASRVCRRLVFLPSTEYRINIEVECYHSYNNRYILIMRYLCYHRIAVLTVSQITFFSQSRHCEGVVISYSSAATAVRLIRLIMLPR